MAVAIFESVEALAAVAPGTALGRSGWKEVTQERVDLFARATGDDQWIHVDPVRAAAGPFGTTIAHGYLTLSLAVPLVAEILDVRGAAMALNYGTNRVRFPAPLPVGTRVRLSATLAGVERGNGWVQVVLDLVFEAEGLEKPVCVAETVYRFYEENGQR